MSMILNEAADVASRKRAIQFLIDNYERCFPMYNDTEVTDAKKKQDAEEYLDKAVSEYCHPIDVLHKLSWTKNLVEGLVRILKTECNDGTDRPANNRMKASLKKVYFAATMYRQKQMWDGIPQVQWLSTNMNGWNFYKLSSVVMPFYDEAMEIYLNGYGDKFVGKNRMLEDARNANANRAADIQGRIDAGEEVTDADREWLNAWNAAQNPEEVHVEVEEDPFANADWGGHVPYTDGKFRIGNKGYWAVRINTHAQSKTWCWWTYPNCPWDQVHNGAQWCITYTDIRHWNMYGMGGRSQIAYYVFKEGFEKLDRTRDGNRATEPYDKWGTSLICVRLSSDPEPTDETIAGFCSRYNHFGQENRDVAQKDGFADNFCNARIDKFCDIVGCTKEEFCQKFKFHEGGNQVNAVNGCTFDVSKLYKRLDDDNYQDLRSVYYIYPYNVNENITHHIVKDRHSGRRNYIINKRLLFTEWAYNIEGLHNDEGNECNEFFYASFDSTVQFYHAGKAILPTPINRRMFETARVYKDKNGEYRYLVINTNDTRSSVYDMKLNKYITKKLVDAKLLPFGKGCFPYFRNRDNIYKLDIKTGTVSQVNRNEIDGFNGVYDNDMSDIRVNANFIYNWYTNTAYVKSTRETIVLPSINIGSPYIVGSYRKWITPDGKVHEMHDIIPDINADGRNIYTFGANGAYLDNKNIVLAGRYRNGKGVYACDADGNVLLNDIEDSDSYYVFEGRGFTRVNRIDRNGECVKSWYISAKGVKEIPSKIRDAASVYVDGKQKVYLCTAEAIYDEAGNPVVKQDDVRGEKITELKTRDDGTNIMKIKTENSEFTWWVKSNKVKDIPGTIVNSFGNDYVLVKSGNTSTVYDDEGTAVLSGPLKMNLPFNSYGIASVMKRNQTIFFNTDNEYSTSPEEMVESMDRRKMATLLETKQPETPFQRYLRIASSFC